MKNSQQTTTDFALLILLLGVHVAFYLWAQPAFFGSDDLGYATFADRIAKGDFVFENHHFAHRLGVTAPTALLYHFFGVNLFTTTLPSLLASLASIAIVYQVAFHLYGRLAAFLAALLLAGNTFLVQQSVYLGADILVVMGGFIGCVLLAKAREQLLPRAIWTHALLAVLLFFFAALAKESVLWVALFVSIVMVHDLAHGRHRLLWASTTLFTLLVAAAYLSCYELLNGDALQRLHAVETVANNPSLRWSYPQWDARLWKRLTYEPLLLILQTSGYVTLLFLALPAFFLPTLRHRYWGGFIVIILFSFWFASSSFKYYTPIGLVDRHILFIVPPLAILAGGVLAHLLQSTSARLALTMAAVGLVLAVVLHLLGYYKREIVLLTGLLFMLASQRWWSGKGGWF